MALRVPEDLLSSPGHHKQSQQGLTWKVLTASFRLYERLVQKACVKDARDPSRGEADGHGKVMQYKLPIDLDTSHTAQENAVHLKSRCGHHDPRRKS